MAKSDKPRKPKIRVCQKTKRIIRKSANGKHAKLITLKTHKSEIPRKGTNEKTNQRRSNKSKSKHVDSDTTINQKIEKSVSL